MRVAACEADVRQDGKVGAMIDLQEVDVTGLLEEAKGRFILGAKSVHGPGHWKAVLANGIAALMQNHGLVVAGSSVRNAVHTTEIIERCSELILRCAMLGKPPIVLPVPKPAANG